MKYSKADYELFSVYKKIKEDKKKFGSFYKSIFHLHSPASHDFKLINSNSYTNFYHDASFEEILELAISFLPFLQGYDFDSENEQLKCYSSKKEFIAYLLVAKKLAIEKIQLAIITDHNNINGFEKLKYAIKLLNYTQKQEVYTSVILGIEISCADKNHVVGIFDHFEKNIFGKINQWIELNIMNEKEGTFLTSFEVIEQINKWNGIPYIAHFDNSNFFKDSSFLNMAYKRKLFSLDCLNVIGLAKREKQDDIIARIEAYSDKEFCYVIDEDSHSIEEIGSNYFWLKGNKCDYKMVLNCLKDFGICIEYEAPTLPSKYIKGLVIKNHGKGFLTSKNKKDDFCLSFSEYLNCFIGGRGTGKSSVINIIEYAIKQNVKDEKELDFICKYSSIWLLFILNEKEYMIKIHNPQKEYVDDSILKSFENCNYDYHHKYNFDKDIIKKQLLGKYVLVYELSYRNNILYYKAVNDKRKYLDTVFNTSYSINELVDTANGDEINNYIYDTIFKNKTLSSLNNTINVKSISGLKKLLTNVSSIKELRKNEVDEIISKFNMEQNKMLRIIYSQKDSNVEIINVRKLISKNIPVRENFYYNRLNISSQSFVDYINSIIDKLGIEKALLLLISKDINTIDNEFPISAYFEEETTYLIDMGITFLKTNSEQKSIILDIINTFFDNNVIEIVNYLKSYVHNIENFSLEFNVNNKEQKKAPAIYKDVRQLSLGQKVVAMLSFVLGYSEFSNDYSPLVIDQPEDNLDNQYIYKNLVRKLKEIKSKRQIIIATHSSTIVTNAKAEQVIVMNSDNKNGWIQATGYPNEKDIKLHIINYLEGGIDSFKHKMFIYNEILKK